MPEQITRTIQLKSQAGETTRAEMTLLTYSSSERKKRSIFALLGFWAAAVCCIPFMIIHLILIPGFIIAGIFYSIKNWKTAEVAQSVSGTCPACEKTITINLDKKNDLPQWQYCPECSDSLELDALPELATQQAT